MTQATLADIQQQLTVFADERDWHKFHSPKNLAMAMVVEAAELVEIFQWQTEAESLAVANDPARFAHLQDELADVMLYCLRIAQVTGIDPLAAMQNKMVKNAVKYPVAGE